MRILAPAALAIAFAGAGAGATLIPDSVYTAPKQFFAIDVPRRLNLYCVLLRATPPSSSRRPGERRG
jgi:hypothetical protein